MDFTHYPHNYENIRDNDDQQQPYSIPPQPQHHVTQNHVTTTTPSFDLFSVPLLSQDLVTPSPGTQLNLVDEVRQVYPSFPDVTLLDKPQPPMQMDCTEKKGGYDMYPGNFMTNGLDQFHDPHIHSEIPINGQALQRDNTFDELQLLMHKLRVHERERLSRKRMPKIEEAQAEKRHAKLWSSRLAQISEELKWKEDRLQYEVYTLCLENAKLLEDQNDWMDLA